ncbi:MAG: DUF3313 family protein [Pseudomonadota bacterium]
MKLYIHRVLLAVFLFPVVSFGTTKPTIDADAIANEQGFIDVNDASLDFVYVQENFDLSSYESVFLDDVVLAFTPSIDEYQLNESERSEVRQSFAEIFPQELARLSGLKVSTSPGENTLRLWLAVTDFSINTSKDAARSGRVDTFARSFGSMTITGIITDSQKSDPIVVFNDTQKPENVFLERLTKSSVRADFRRVLRNWAVTISTRFAQAKTMVQSDKNDQ